MEEKIYRTFIKMCFYGYGVANELQALNKSNKDLAGAASMHTPTHLNHIQGKYCPSSLFSSLENGQFAAS